MEKRNLFKHELTTAFSGICGRNRIGLCENTKIMKRFFLLFFTLSGVLSQINAQRLEKFSADPAEFTVQLEEMMTASKNDNLVETFFNFQAIFMGGGFTQEEAAMVINTSNGMLANGLRANPNFYDYLNGLIALKKRQNAPELLKQWHAVLDQMTLAMETQKAKPIKAYLEFSKDLFESNALRQSSAGGTTWVALSNDFQLAYENDEAIIRYENTAIKATRLKDSIMIVGTSGVFYPDKQLWKGKGGKVDWSRYGYDETIYAELGDYEIETIKSIYETPNAKMHHPLYFGGTAVSGKFTDKLGSYSEEDGGTYPRFESDAKKLNINNVGEGVKFLGGFRLYGTTVYGYGDKANKSQIVISNNRGRTILKGNSEQFTIRRGERISGEHVETVLYYGKDSIYHPSVNLRYDIAQQKIQLVRGDRGSDRNPFYDSYRDFNINTENIDVYIDSDSLIIGKPTVSIARKGAVEFESLQFFNAADYNRIQSIATSNPLAIMKATVEREGTNFINANLLASRINSKFTVKNIESLLYDLVARGFVNYDSDEQIIEVKQKVMHYVNADQEFVDFDHLKIVSDTKGVNAAMKMGQLDMVVNGVERVILSQKNRVAMKPLGNQLLMKKIRNFDADGKVFSGFASMEGKDFHFDYDKFNIKADSIRFFDLYVPTGGLDKNQQPVAYSIGSRIEHAEGTLLIDAQNNKSGKEDIEMFPSFQSKGKSYVYYFRDSTQHFAYPRDSFYFELNPFSLNKLDKITASDLEFKGTLFSSEIFPDIKETILLRQDQSLGFIHKTSEKGLPVYTGKGNYTGEIDLSNAGLQGRGKLKYLGATINSEDIVFKPKQLTGSAKQFKLKEDRTGNPQIPNAEGVDVTINWKPYRDSMYVKSEEAAFKIFNDNNHTLDGTLILTPGGLKADGLLDWDKASMRSHLLSFGGYSVKADTTNLSIKSFDSDELALKTSNVKGDVDFEKQVGNFLANDDFLITELPYNKYITSMNEFAWNMKKGTIQFKSDLNKPGNFTSVHPDQDSLHFEGKDAFYDINSSELAISGVPYILTADAFVYPDSGLVNIQKGGLMTKLENAKIIADTVNRYHVINRANVEILGKKYYTANGFYEYNIPGKEQEIEFQNIVGQRVGKGKLSEKRAVTRATGTISEEQEFYIDKKTTFQGTISLNAESKALKFDGFARLEAEQLPAKLWFNISCEGDKKDLAIQYDKPKSIDGEPVQTGLYLSKETARIYPRVMMPLYFRKDRAVFPTKGVFKYNEQKDEFAFGDSTKVISNDLTGNIFTFKNRDGSVLAEGKFNLCSALNYIKVDAAGIGQTKFPPPAPEVDPNMITLDTLSTVAAAPVEFPVTAELMCGIQLIIPDAVMKVMINDFNASSFDARIISYLTDIGFYRKAAFELFPNNKDIQTAVNGMSSGYFDVPKKYNPYTFLFSRLKLKWDVDYQSFVTTEKSTGLATLNGENINRRVEAYIEFKMPSNDDDRLYIYIKSPSELYYFFGYKQGILNVVSNNPAFMEALRGLKAKDKITKMGDGNTYEIQEVEPETAQRFLRRIQAVNN